MRNNQRFISLALASSMLLSQFSMTAYAVQQEIEEETSLLSQSLEESTEKIESTIEGESAPITPLQIESQTMSTTSAKWLDVDWAEGGKIEFDSATGTITGTDASVSSVYIPSTIDGVPVTTIGSMSFAHFGSSLSTGKLRVVSLPEGVTRIETQGFTGNCELTALYLPKSLEYIGNLAFTTTLLGSGVKAIFYAGSEEEWKQIEINDSNLTKNAEIIYDYGAAIYEIIFDFDGGRTVEGQVYYLSVKEETNRQGTLDNLPESPVKGGYEFSHWEDSKGNTVTLDTVFEDDITVTAVWTECTESHNITFDSLGGSSVSSMKTSQEGNLYWLPENPTRTQYFFKGWYLEDTYETKVTTSTKFTEDTTVYGKWEESYKITFFHRTLGSEIIMYTNASGCISKLPEDPEWDNYVFGGWYTDLEYTTKVTSTTVFDSDTTVYAKWDIFGGHVISFESNGGSEVASINTNINDNLTKLPTTPTRNGFSFEGWFLDDGTFLEQVYALTYTAETLPTPLLPSTVFTENTTVYAKWKHSYVNNSGFNPDTDAFSFLNRADDLAGGSGTYSVESLVKDKLENQFIGLLSNKIIDRNDYNNIFGDGIITEYRNNGEIEGAYYRLIEDINGNGLKADGLCFGIAALEMLLHSSDKVNPWNVDPDAGTVKMIAQPNKSDDVLYQVLYYFLLQFLEDKSPENRTPVEDEEIADLWLDKLTNSTSPFVLDIQICDVNSQNKAYMSHAVLLYGYEFGEHTFIYDEKKSDGFATMTKPEDRSPEPAHIFYISDPNATDAKIYISEGDEPRIEIIANTSSKEDLYAKLYNSQIVNVREPLALEEFNNYILPNSSRAYSLSSEINMSSNERSNETASYTTITTRSVYDFTIESNGDHATVKNMTVSGDLDVDASYMTTLESTEISEYVTYQLDSDDATKFTFATSEPRGFVVRMSGDTMYFINTDAKEITLTKEGKVELNGASGDTHSVVTLMLDGDVATPWYGTEIATTNTDIVITPSANNISMTSTQALSGMQVNCHEFIGDSEKTITLEDTETTTVTLSPKDDGNGNINAQILDENNDVVGEVEVVPNTGSDNLPSEDTTTDDTTTGTSSDDSVPETETTISFSDVSASDWFYEQVTFVAEKGLMNGTSTTEFSPMASTTRGMIVTILHSLAGYPEPTTTAGFEDVSSSDWYGNAVAWAKEVGITSGMTETTFDPNGFMTREQLVVMLYAYEKQFGDGGFQGLWAFPLDFTDSETISEWANEATTWCVMNHIVGGRDTGDFDPKAIANRAEVATILMNFVNLYE